MKKVALSLLAFGLIGAGAFAQAAPAAPTVTIGDWGRQITAFGNAGSSGYWINTGASWGGAPRITGLNIQGKTDNGGFSITPSADGGKFGLTDQNKAWVTFYPGLTFETGIDIETDTWRGADGFGSWNNLRFNKENGDNVTFSRLGNNGSGFQSDINYNKDGIGAWADVNFGTTDSNGDGPTGISNIGNALQIGAAYTITGVGQIKAQYLGYKSNTEGFNTQFGTANLGTKAFGAYQVAFNLSSVKDLTAEVAIQVPTASKDAGYTYQFSAVAGYTMDKVAFHLEVIDVAYTDDLSGNKAGQALGGGIGLDYDLGNSLSVGGDVRYRNGLAAASGANTGADAFEGVYVGITKNFSNGLIGIGFEYANEYGFSFGGPGVDTTKAQWAIPVTISEWF